MADASIYSLIRPVQQAQDPIQQYGQALNLKSLLGQQELQGLQLQQARQSMEDDAAVSAAYKESGGNQDRLKEILYGRGLYKPAQQVEKSTLERRKLESEIGKNEAGIRKSDLDSAITKMERAASLLSVAKDPQSYAVVRSILSKDYPEAANSIPEQFDPQFIQAKIAEGQTITQRLQDLRAKEGQQITIRGQNISAETAKRGQDISAATTRRGQDMTDTRQREANAVSAATAQLKQRELEGTLSQKDAAQEQAMASYDTAIATLDRLNKHPGKQAAVGAGIGKTLLPLVGPIPGTDRAGFQAELDTFKAQTFLPMVQQLKGMGALSDAEGQKLSAAVGALTPDMPEKDFNASIDLIKRDLMAAKQRAASSRSKPSNGKIGGVLTQNPDGSFNYGFN